MSLSLLISTPLLATGDLDAQARTLATEVCDALAKATLPVGTPIGTLTMREAVQPMLDGRPHGLYLVLLGDTVVYVGSNRGRAFHERLAGHLYAGNGWFNSCVQALAQHRGTSTDEALLTLLDEARILCVPLCIAHGDKAMRRALLKLEHAVARELEPLNGRAKAR
jgi:hypothetical protein